LRETTRGADSRRAAADDYDVEVCVQKSAKPVSSFSLAMSRS
jgi:hypothetical protein